MALIYKEASNLEVSDDYIRAVGAPNKMVTDNAQFLTGKNGPILIADSALQLISPYISTNTRTSINK